MPYVNQFLLMWRCKSAYELLFENMVNFNTKTNEMKTFSLKRSCKSLGTLSYTFNIFSLTLIPPPPLFPFSPPSRVAWC